jgi:DNA-binding cell septation regulator SpoVG
MKVTGFDLRKSNVEKTHAYGKIVIENVIQVEVSIKDSKNGLFVAFPTKRGSDNKWYPQFKIIDREISDSIQEQVIYWYEKNLKNV